jgi:hypothetical protein
MALKSGPPQAAHQGLPETSDLTPTPKSVRLLPLRADACPTATKRRPPSRPATGRRNRAPRNGRASQPALFPHFQAKIPAKIPACMSPWSVFPSECSEKYVCDLNNLTKRFASFGRCPFQNWHFDQKTALEARPHRACRKRSFEGTPVPGMGRE